MRRGTGATWQSHAGPRERLRGAEVTRGHYLYLIVICRVIVHISIRYFGFKLTSYLSRIINPTYSINFSRVGLIHMSF